VVTACAFPLFALLIGENTDFHMALWGHSYLVALFGSAVFMALGKPGLAFVGLVKGADLRNFSRASPTRSIWCTSMC